MMNTDMNENTYDNFPPRSIALTYLRLVMRQVTSSPGTGVGPARWGAQRKVQLVAANESCR